LYAARDNRGVRRARPGADTSAGHALGRRAPGALVRGRRTRGIACAVAAGRGRRRRGAGAGATRWRVRRRPLPLGAGRCAVRRSRGDARGACRLVRATVAAVATGGELGRGRSARAAEVAFAPAGAAASFGGVGVRGCVGWWWVRARDRDDGVAGVRPVVAVQRGEGLAEARAVRARKPEEGSDGPFTGVSRGDGLVDVQSTSGRQRGDGLVGVKAMGARQPEGGSCRRFIGVSRGDGLVGVNAMGARQRGFTLIEILLATTLLAAGLALGFATLRAATATVDRGEALAERTERMRAVEGFLRRRLSSAPPIAFAIEEESGRMVRFIG